MKTSHTLRIALAAAALAVAGGAQALDPGSVVRVAAGDYSAAPANAAPGMPGRAEGDREQRPAAANDMSATEAKQKISDVAITTKVKTKLLATKDLKSTGIHVKTRDGVVMLTGSVPSSQQREMALSVARSVHGVGSVNDDLKVVTR